MSFRSRWRTSTCAEWYVELLRLVRTDAYNVYGFGKKLKPRPGYGRSDCIFCAYVPSSPDRMFASSVAFVSACAFSDGRTVSGWLPATVASYAGLNPLPALFARNMLLRARLKSAV